MSTDIRKQINRLKNLNENNQITKLLNGDKDYITISIGSASAELNVEVLENGELSIYISEIYSNRQQQGEGTVLLNYLKKFSDKSGVPLCLRASTTNNIKANKGISQEKLISWYQKNGFEISEENNAFPADPKAPFMIYNYN